MKKKGYLIILFTLLYLVIAGGVMADDDAIMDVDDSRATFSGSWYRSGLIPCAIGGSYTYIVGSAGGASATFTTEQTADISGYYMVYARWSSYSNRNDHARYRIYDENTYRTTVYRDQRYDGCNWRYLATVYLTSGHHGKVIIDGYGASSGEVTIADAVRFVRVTKDGGDIQDGSITGADILNGSIYDYDIADEPGIEYSSGISRDVSDYITTNCNALSNLASVTVNMPTSGYVWVHADGIYNPTYDDKWVRIGIDDASGGSSFDSLAPYLESPVDTAFERERRFAVSNVYYYSSSGTRTFYLKACRESGADGIIIWDDFVAMFFPTRY